MVDYLIPLMLILAGLLFLVVGGELLVRGASRLATAIGISPLVVGLTVVAFGTSAPELAVTLQASLRGEPDLALGNVVGSNICNILLILGASALAAPLAVPTQLLQRDVPLMILASVLLLVLGWDGNIGRGDGCLLFAGLVGYVVWAIVRSRRESREATDENPPSSPACVEPRSKRIVAPLLFVVVGLVLLTLGSGWLVHGAVAIARLLGVTELLIGLTIVAVGTSLPELAASVVASLRGEREIAVGNVVGSNLFNILSVLGLSALVAPHGIAVPRAALHSDIPIMIGVAVACLPIFLTRRRVDRWEGGVLLACYAAYTIHLILGASSQSPAL